MKVDSQFHQPYVAARNQEAGIAMVRPGAIKLHILGTRGIPAQHGGFETFAEQLSLYLASRGHDVTVYCQIGPDEEEFTDVWEGVHRIAFSVRDSPLGTIAFDLRCALAASRHRNATILTLGYNTAIFSIIHRLRGVRHLMNMDGIEWKRPKWSKPQRAWLWFNEWCGSHLANLLVADHPEIKKHLERNVSSKKISVIPYAANPIYDADPEIVRQLGLDPGGYFLVIARAEPENSLLEIVEAYMQKPRSRKLLILGKYDPENKYHSTVLNAATDSNVLFPGAIYDSEKVQALRFYAAAYLHGHQVGGTNPSLVEALAAGNAIIAHNNKFNRWVAGPGARYFNSMEHLAAHFDEVQNDPCVLDGMRQRSKLRHRACFTNDAILGAYEQLILGHPLAEGIW